MLISFEKVAHDYSTFAQGERYFVVVVGASSEYVVHGVSIPCAIYSFIGKGTDAEQDGEQMTETPAVDTYFPFVSNKEFDEDEDCSGLVFVVDENCRTFSCSVTVRLLYFGQKKTLNVECRDSDLFSINQTVQSFDRKAFVVVTGKKHIENTFGECVEVGLYSLNTAKVFKPNSEVAVKLADKITLMFGQTEEDGSISVPCKTPFGRQYRGPLVLQFVDTESNSLIDVQDNEFEATLFIDVIVI